MHITQGHTGKHRVTQDQREKGTTVYESLHRDFHQKNRQVGVAGLRLASLNSFHGLCGTGAVPGCLVPDSGIGTL